MLNNPENVRRHWTGDRFEEYAQFLSDMYLVDCESQAERFDWRCEVRSMLPAMFL